jgi:hypothetical protein
MTVEKKDGRERRGGYLFENEHFPEMFGRNNAPSNYTEH